MFETLEASLDVLVGQLCASIQVVLLEMPFDRLGHAAESLVSVGAESDDATRSVFMAANDEENICDRCGASVVGVSPINGVCLFDSFSKSSSSNESSLLPSSPERNCL